jgi:hypothetical protein
MDPIHPIVTPPPVLPPITPAPMAGRIDREGPRGDGGEQGRRRRKPRSAGAEDRQDYSFEDDGDDDAGEGFHISVTA